MSSLAHNTVYIRLSITLEYETFFHALYLGLFHKTHISYKIMSFHHKGMHRFAVTQYWIIPEFFAMYVCYDNDSIHFEQSLLYLDIQDIYYSTHVFHLEIQRH